MEGAQFIKLQAAKTIPPKKLSINAFEIEQPEPHS